MTGKVRQNKNNDHIVVNSMNVSGIASILDGACSTQAYIKTANAQEIADLTSGKPDRVTSGSLYIYLRHADGFSIYVGVHTIFHTWNK